MARKLKNNEGGTEKLALHTLQGNGDLNILPADKGNMTVVLNTIDYPSLPEDVTEQLQPHGSRPPRLYWLPKIHKVEAPLTPTISTIWAPT
jgi:hypothetical protein